MLNQSISLNQSIMVPSISRAAAAYYFVPWNAAGPEKAAEESALDSTLSFRSARQACDFLRAVARGRLAFAELRRLARSADNPDLSRYSDEQVLQRVGFLLVNGHLSVVERLYHAYSSTATAGAASPAYEPPPAERQPAKREPPPPDPETFSADVLQDDQAATLVNAARNGVPFCEECEKARLAAAGGKTGGKAGGQG